MPSVLDDQVDVEKKINSLNTLGSQNRDLIGNAIEAIADPEVKTSERLVKIKAIVEGTNQKIETAVPVLTQMKERITRTMGMSKFDEPKFNLAMRRHLWAEEMQDFTIQEFQTSGLDLTPMVNKVAQENEGLAQFSKSIGGWGGELIQTRHLSETISQKTEERVQQAVAEEKKKKFILF